MSPAFPVVARSLRSCFSSALGNYVGNCVATVAVASWEGDIDREKAHRVLNGEVAAIDMGTAAVPVGIDASGAQLQTS